MKPIFSILLASLAIFWGVNLQAGVKAFRGTEGEELFIEGNSGLGPKVYLVKFTGVSSPWASKVIKTQKESRTDGDRYSFVYKVELSSGVQERIYQILVSGGKALVKGSMVDKIRLYTPGSRDGILFHQDLDLTQSSQKIDLLRQYKETPFTPQVD